MYIYICIYTYIYISVLGALGYVHSTYVGLSGAPKSWQAPSSILRAPSEGTSDEEFRAQVVLLGASALDVRDHKTPPTWTSKMPKRMDPTLPILAALGYWTIFWGALRRSR